MPKQVLGRNLGALLGRNPKEGAPPVSAGVRSLMRGNGPPQPVVAPKPLIPRWYLFAGDVLLVALALITILKSPRPLSWPRVVFCVAVVILAALLAILALFTRDSGASGPVSRAGTGVAAKGETPE
jgi:hypothetical protein